LGREEAARTWDNLDVVRNALFTLVRDDGYVVCDQCGVAATFKARLVGLLGRHGLATGEGLLIRPTNSIHTFFMRFPIDVVFLDRQGVVVKLVSNVRPWRVTFAPRGRDAVELRAGEADAKGIRLGDRLALRTALAVRTQGASA
jgi:uncharacterized membrane protein (UPF0127 family)